jgi:hypothetical protein
MPHPINSEQSANSLCVALTRVSGVRQKGTSKQECLHRIRHIDSAVKIRICLVLRVEMSLASRDWSLDERVMLLKRLKKYVSSKLV